jgi:predicted O-methyltransferase YrrM
MNPVLEEIERAGATLLPNGTRVPVHSGVNAEGGRVLRHSIQVAAPRLGCEVGLAYGVSSLYILDAMREFGGGRLIGMDPAQHDGTWQGGGLHNIRRAGFEEQYTFREATSQLVLPELAAQGTRIQFAFIDGWHTFDHALVDFFYLDMMMDVGGVMVLDDVGSPGLQRLAHFIVTNRAYSFLDGVARPVPSGPRQTLKNAAKRLFGPLVRDDHTPCAASLRMEEPVNRCQLIALKKNDSDHRRFDHFEPF